MSTRATSVPAAEPASEAASEPVVYDWCTGLPLPPRKPRNRPATLPGCPAVEVWGDVPPNALDQPEARMQDPEVQERLLGEYRNRQAEQATETGFDWEGAARYWGLDLDAEPFVDHREGTP